MKNKKHKEFHGTPCTLELKLKTGQVGPRGAKQGQTGPKGAKRGGAEQKEEEERPPQNLPARSILLVLNLSKDKDQETTVTATVGLAFPGDNLRGGLEVPHQKFNSHGYCIKTKNIGVIFDQSVTQ